MKHGIHCGAGVIDADYRGNVGIVLFNFGDKSFTVKVGDRIAQLIIEKISNTFVEVVSDLTETDRGADGFGSSGRGPLQRAVLDGMGVGWDIGDRDDDDTV